MLISYDNIHKFVRTPIKVARNTNRFSIFCAISSVLKSISCEEAP